MSQKPRTGAQSKPPATKVASRDAPEKATPIETAAAAEAGPVTEPEVTPLAEPEVTIEPMAEFEAEPEVNAAPTPESAPVIIPEPVVAPPVAAMENAEIAEKEAIEATAEIAPALAEAPPELAEAQAEPVTAAFEPVASLTTQTVKTATTIAIKPTQTTLTRGMKTMMKSTEDFVAFGQANLEAFMKSGQIWSAGVQELTKQFATSAKASFEDSMSTFKAMSTAKSVKEAMELQSTFAKATLEKAMAESNKLTDASIKLTEQTLAPITARVTVAVETFGKTA
jgi:phasin family protein